MSTSDVVPYDFELKPYSDNRFEFSFRHQCDFEDLVGRVHISGAFSSIMCVPHPASTGDQYLWELMSQDPITIHPSILCRNCGMHG